MAKEVCNRCSGIGKCIGNAGLPVMCRFCDGIGFVESLLPPKVEVTIPITDTVTGVAGYYTYETGAKRGTDHADCNVALIPREALQAWGRAFAEGERKYGRDNWLKGFPQVSVLRNAIEHIYAYLDGDTSEDHLGHAMWNLGTAIYQDVNRPDMDDRPPYPKVLEIRKLRESKGGE